MDDAPPPPPSLWQHVQSVLAAGLGVQSEQNRRRDFDRGSPTLYFTLGIIGTVLFILTLAGVVRWVLSGTGH